MKHDYNIITLLAYGHITSAETENGIINGLQ